MKNQKFYFLTIICVNILLYYPLLDFDFLYQWDDQWQVINPMTEGGFTPNNIHVILTSTFRGQYSPVNQLFYIIIYNIAGFTPRYFHALNLCFHIANCILVYYTSSYLFGLSICKGSVRNFRLMAFYVSLLFAIHPLNVEPICWISASKLVLGTFFFLLATILYVKFQIKKSIILYVSSVLMALISVGCKEQFIILTPTLILINIFIFNTGKGFMINFIYTLPFFVISAIFIIICYYCNSSLFENDILPSNTLYDKLIFLSYSLFSYILMATLPFKLSYIYPYIYDKFTTTSWIYIIYPIIISFLVYIFYLHRQNRFLLFMGLLFVAQLLPVLHIIPLPRKAMMADRYMYTSLIPFLCVIVYYFNIAIHNKKKYIKLIYICYSLVYIIYLASYSYSYKFCWKDSICLKKSVINQTISISKIWNINN